MTAPDWKVGLVRLTCFVPPGVAYKDPGWWEKFIGQPPEAKTAKPKEGSEVISGPGLGGAATLSLDPSRIDWILNTAEEVTNSPDLPTLGGFRDVAGKFRDFASDWLKVAPTANRIAFGALLLLPAKDRQEGYRGLSQILKTVEVDPVDSEDFLFQINRPRKSQVLEGLRINRLTKWSVGVLRGLSLRLIAGKANVMANANIASSHYFCRLELDVNTDAERIEPLPPQHMAEIFGELVDQATEIAERGDLK